MGEVDDPHGATAFQMVEDILEQENIDDHGVKGCPPPPLPFFFVVWVCICVYIGCNF